MDFGVHTHLHRANESLRKESKMGTRFHWIALCAMVLAVLASSGCAPPGPPPTVIPSPTVTPPTSPPLTPNPQWGIAWSTDFRIHSAPPIQTTQMAAGTGATWDRWTFEWPRIEFTSAQELYFVNENYADPAESWNYNLAVGNDKTAGLKILGVLNGIPEKKYLVRTEGQERGTIQGLDNPPFVEGHPNPNNPWAYFVYGVTSQYADSVDAWEIGNEADDLWMRNFPVTPETYLKALRVACQIIAQTDPGAPILLGSPTYGEAWNALVTGKLGPPPEEASWYYQVVNLLLKDSEARNCISAAGLHVYGNPMHSYTLVTALSEWLDKEVWLTETGKQHPVDAIPGDANTDNESNCPKDPNTGRNAFPCGTTAEQASYIIRNFATCAITCLF